MNSICLIHNHERDRLSYLMPQVEALARAMPAATVHAIGPARDYAATRLRRHSRLNRLRRAAWWGIIADRDRMLDPRRPGVSATSRYRQFRDNVRMLFHDYTRSIAIEHDVLLAHARAWRIAADNTDAATFVFESDVRFPPDAASRLAALAAAYRGDRNASYVVIAGGCDRKTMLCSWCFEREHGCEQTTVGGIAMLRVPLFVNNTTAGYMLTPAAARIFCELMRRPPMLAPDWAMMAWSLRGKLAKIACLHCAEPILEHGSVAGAYPSTIAASAAQIG